jgi:hypothetical protein
MLGRARCEFPVLGGYLSVMITAGSFCGARNVGNKIDSPNFFGKGKIAAKEKFKNRRFS